MKISIYTRLLKAISFIAILLGEGALGAERESPVGVSEITSVPEISAVLLGLVGAGMLVLRRSR